jgi:N-acetyl-gamma-glutamyl-phosphate reductase
VVFLAVPAGTAMEMAGDLLALGVKVVDFSADFRLHNPNTYATWYRREHVRSDLLHQAVYGLPELYAPKIAQTDLVANPGCYPTSVILALHAAIKHDLIHLDDLIIDSKSGTTGAGRKAAIPTLYCEVADNFRAYGLPAHRHIPEIEQELSLLAQKDVRISFVTHLLPANRGILSTIYTRLKNPEMDAETIRQIYLDTWKDSPWIRILPEGQLPEIRFVRGSMFCDLSLVPDPRTGRLIIISTIDNLCRGASGQALANANLMCGLPVTSGLEALAPLA